MVIPFEEYDFENDAKYAAYLNNVELTGAAHEQAALLKRLQAKWYKNNVVRGHKSGACVRLCSSVLFQCCIASLWLLEHCSSAAGFLTSLIKRPPVPPSRKQHMQDPDFVPPQATKDEPPQYADMGQTKVPPTGAGTTTPEPAATQAPRGPSPSQTAVPTSLIPGMNALAQAVVWQPGCCPFSGQPHPYTGPQCACEPQMHAWPDCWCSADATSGVRIPGFVCDAEPQFASHNVRIHCFPARLQHAQRVPATLAWNAGTVYSFRLHSRRMCSV